MPPKPISNVMTIPRGYRSAEAASFIGQLDDLTERLIGDLHGLTARELQWQPGPGRNSIGMLLAHQAIVEVWWLGGPARGRTDVDFPRIIGIGGDDDGMPAPPTGRHPRVLRGKPLSFYLRLLERARAYVRRIARTMSPRDLDRPMKRFWVSQKTDHYFNNRWVLYHVLEHLAGHYGQILLLKELMRAPKKPRRAKRTRTVRGTAPRRRTTRAGTPRRRSIRGGS
jgi:uncharacterized damage-inducible protein DinB